MRAGTMMGAAVGRKGFNQRGLMRLLALLALWVLAFLPTWLAWLRLCLSDPQYEHGPIVAALGVFLVGHQLLRLSDGMVKLRQIDAVLLFLVVVAWAMAWLAGISALQQLLVVLAGLAIVQAALGRAAAVTVVLPLMILLTATEVWEHAAVPLQSLTATVVGSTLPWFGVPAVVEANRVVVPAGEFVVEQGCAGIKYIMTMLAMAILAISVSDVKPRLRALLLAFAVSLALVANWVRVGIVIYVGQITELRHPWVHDHYTLGWILFGIFLVPFLIVTRRVADRGQGARSAAPVASATSAPTAASAFPFTTVTILLLASLVWMAVGVSQSGGVGRPIPPPVIASEDAARIMPTSLQGDGIPSVSLWRYDGSEAPIQLARMIVRPPLPADGVTLLRAAILGPDEFLTVGESTGSVQRADRHVIRFAERVIYSPKLGRRMTRWWFEVGASTFDSSLQAKAMLLSELALGNDEMTITMLEVACEPDCASATILLDTFMGHLAQRKGESS